MKQTIPAAPLSPPAANRIPQPKQLHGVTLEDDYGWLREKDSAPVLDYLHAENAHTAATMAGTEGLQQTLYTEILSHIQEDDASVPYRQGDWEYLTRTQKGLQYARYCRYPAGQPAQESVLLDVNLLAEGHPFMSVGALAVSPDAKLLAYTTDDTGFRQYTLHVMNIATRELLPETAERVGSVVWAADSTTLLFTTEDEQTKRQDRLFRLALGSAANTEETQPNPPQTSGAPFIAPSSASTSTQTPGAPFIAPPSASTSTETLAGAMSGKPQKPAAPRSGPAQIFHEPVVVFHEEDERFNLGLGRTRDRKYLLLEAGSHTTSETWFLDATTPTASFQLIAPRIDDEEYSVDHRDGFFYIHTNHAAEQFRIMRVPVSALLKTSTNSSEAVALKGTGFSPSTTTAQQEGASAPEDSRPLWQELIPENKEAPLEDFDLFQTFLVATYRERGLPLLQVFPLTEDGLPGTPAAIRFPDPAFEAHTEINVDFSATTLRYAYQSLVRPASVFRYDVATGASTLLKQQAVPGGFDATRYTSERLWFAAEDGTQIPISLVYRTDLFRKAESPLYVYGYGSYGYALPLGFGASRLDLLDRGVVMAYAHIRGGGELGDPWHDAGKMMQKRNTFTDFIQAVEHLTAHGYGDPARVAIEGGSAGGLLMGAVVNFALEQGKPALFRAVLSHVPFVDVMNTMLDASLPLTVAEYEEWGNPNEPEAFATMLSYSPYENLKPGPYPAMLVKTSLNDSQVMYWEPAKYIAKLRTLKSNATPLLLHINMDAGHGGASGRYDYLKEIAFDHAFLLRELGLV